MLESNGFVMVESVLDAPEVARLIDHMGSSALPGRRNILTDPVIKALAFSESVRNLVEPILGSEAFPVRGIFFDKTPEANWIVPWHQDLSIAVEQRHEMDGYGPWSVKEGVVHVQPPASILEQMVTVRLHLDDCGEDNGPVLVIPGSHRFGKMREAEISERLSAEVACTGPAGGALIMRPLILHASRKSKHVAHRRVIHLEFSAKPLPLPLAFCGFVP